MGSNPTLSANITSQGVSLEFLLSRRKAGDDGRTGVTVSHTTILRWVLRYVPEFEKRWARYARPVNPSWRMDETAVSVRGGKHYLYRAVDRQGKSVDHLLWADRSRDAQGRINYVAQFHPRAVRRLRADFRRVLDIRKGPDLKAQYPERRLNGHSRSSINIHPDVSFGALSWEERVA